MYADDTALFCDATWKNINLIRRNLEQSLGSTFDWYKSWKINVHPDKTEFIIFTKSTKMIRMLDQFPPSHANQTLRRKTEVKYLGLTLDTKPNFKSHISKSIQKANGALSTLYCIMKKQNAVNVESKIAVYRSYIRPIITYASTIFHNCPKTHFQRLQIFQNECLRMALNKEYGTANLELHREAKIPTIEEFVTKTSD
jgi:hypothetical protein